MTASAEGISTGGYVCQTCSSGGAASGVSSASRVSAMRVLRVVGGALLDGRERDAPAAARVVGVGLREPVAEQLRRAGEQLLAVEAAAAGPRRVEALRAERAVEGRQVGDAQPPAARVAVPVGRQDGEGEAQIVDVALGDRAPVVGGVEEVRDPRGGVAARDRGARHPREAQRPGLGHVGALDLRVAVEVVEVLRKLVAELVGALFGHAVPWSRISGAQPVCAAAPRGGSVPPRRTAPWKLRRARARPSGPCRPGS